MILYIISYLIYYIYKNDLHNEFIWPNYIEMIFD